MPIYEYRCGECGQVFEALQRVHDEPLDTCRHCGGPAERMISSPAIHFVGSGWYVTDYARKGKDEGRESKGDGKSDDRGEGKGKEGKKAESGGEAGGSSAGAAKNGRSSGEESSRKGSAGGRSAGSGGKTADARTERRAGAGT